MTIMDANQVPYTAP